MNGITEALKQMSNQTGESGLAASVTVQQLRSTAKPSADPDHARKRELASLLFSSLIKPDIDRIKAGFVDVIAPGIAEIKGTGESESRRLAGEMLTRLTVRLSEIAIETMSSTFTLEQLDAIFQFHSQNDWYQAKMTEFASQIEHASRSAIADQLKDLMNEAVDLVVSSLSVPRQT